MKDGLQFVLEDLIDSLNNAAGGPFVHLFSGVLGYITQNDIAPMAEQGMGAVDEAEAIARALNLVKYADDLGEHCKVVLRVTGDVLERNTKNIMDNYAPVGELLKEDGFDETRRKALVGQLKAAAEALGASTIIMFQMPPIEA